jgi:fumarate hydratase class II
VPADKYWGPETQRALNGCICVGGGLPERFYRSYGYIKRAAAVMNQQAGRLPSWKSEAIARAADDLIAGLLADQFPLPIWQSGSGRDADNNVNEVLANRAAQLLGGVAGRRNPVDPVRDVAMGQNLDGTFTASMFIATVMEIEQGLVPFGSALVQALVCKSVLPSDQPRRLRDALARLDEAEGSLHEISVDPLDAALVTEATADRRFLIQTVATDTGRPFIFSDERYSERGALDAIIAAMAAVRGVAVVLLDIADAVRTVRVSGQLPRLHAEGEAVAMACLHVIGQDQLVVASARREPSRGCAMWPLIVASVLSSARQLGQACEAARRIVVRVQ